MNLATRYVEKPWGVERLPAPFAGTVGPDTVRPGQKWGEIWFEPPDALPQLLVKYIFTSEKLSVQVHPSDAQTLTAGLGRQGKEECWLVIGAEPDATLGIGFHEAIGAQAMRAAALDGRIEDLLVWHAVAPGDFFYIPANTVHAIGGGVSLIEIQQNSDITYRLYDYGRPRELHLDAGLAVARGEIYDLARWHRRLAAGGDAALVDGPWFRLDRVAGRPSAQVAARYAGAALLVVPLAGEARVAGEMVAPGGCGVALDLATVDFDPEGLCLLAQPVAS